MTYLANILPHPQKNRLIQLFGNYHYEKLYEQVKTLGLPFFQWNGWIKKQLDDAVELHKLQSETSSVEPSQLITQTAIPGESTQSEDTNGVD